MPQGNAARTLKKINMKTHAELLPVINQLKEQFERNGFAIAEGIYSKEEIGAILYKISAADNSGQAFRKTADLFAIRRFLHEVPAVKELVFNKPLESLIHNLFGHDYFVVKSIYIDKRKNVEIIRQKLNSLFLEPAEVNPFLETIGSSAISEKQKAAKILLRPNLNLKHLAASVASLNSVLRNYSNDDLEQTEIQVKYERYIEKEQELVERMAQMENLVIPDSFNYDGIAALSNEALQKFKRIKPRTLGQASRISGVNPSDVQILMVYMGR